MALKKSEAVKLFGGNKSQMARQLGVSRRTIYSWPEDLPVTIEDQIRGCLARIAEEHDRRVEHAFGGS